MHGFLYAGLVVLVLLWALWSSHFYDNQNFKHGDDKYPEWLKWTTMVPYIVTFLMMGLMGVAFKLFLWLYSVGHS